MEAYLMLAWLIGLWVFGHNNESAGVAYLFGTFAGWLLRNANDHGDKKPEPPKPFAESGRYAGR